MIRRLALAAVSLVLAAPLLVSCSGDDGGDDPEVGAGSGAPSSSTPPTPEPVDYLPVPEGVELSTPGSAFELGSAAVVAYQPRQDVVGALEIKVTRLERATFKKQFIGWQLDEATRRSTPYFVRATVTNRGSTDLGGRPVPLYIVDGTNTLIEATAFKSQFSPCTPGAFPDVFAPGESRKVCLVYLAPEKGDLVSVSFRPTQEFDPITWSGELKDPRTGGKRKKPKAPAAG